jgi:hypothetical protein
MKIEVDDDNVKSDVTLVEKEVDGDRWVGVQMSLSGVQVDDSIGFVKRREATITFWGKTVLRRGLRQAIALIDEHFSSFLSEDQESVDQRSALQLIAAERQRQVALGYNADHDSQHTQSTLARAAASWACAAVQERSSYSKSTLRMSIVYQLWPWGDRRPKPATSASTAMRALVKAGALCVAGIQQLQHATQEVEPLVSGWVVVMQRKDDDSGVSFVLDFRWVSTMEVEARMVTTWPSGMTRGVACSVHIDKTYAAPEAVTRWAVEELVTRAARGSR